MIIRKTKIKVRKAKIKDADEISNLNYLLMKYHEKFDNYYKINKNHRKIYSKYIKKFIRSKNTLVLVAEVDKKIVGLMLGAIEKRPPIMKVVKFGHLKDTFVLPGYRRRGIGKILAKELMKWFESKEVEFVELESDIRNKIGVKAWKSLGFKPFMVKMKKKHLDGE